jgi:hypothetical protein
LCLSTCWQAGKGTNRDRQWIEAPSHLDADQGSQGLPEPEQRTSNPVNPVRKKGVIVKLKDQKVVIIGGSSGIGLATARAALDEGA